MRILAIDPGTNVSGYALLVDNRVEDSGVIDNWFLLDKLTDYNARADELVIEMISGMGMAVGKSTFETCVWIGRFFQEWQCLNGKEATLIPRNQIKVELCGSARAKDANIRQRCIDVLGEPGTKKDKGPTYGVKSHAWQALGVALTYKQQKLGAVYA